MKKAFVFDFDDTLATTECQVLVRSQLRGGANKVVKRLTPEQFNTYRLPELCSFDFSEFLSEKFIREAKPTFLINLAQEVHREGHAVYVLTARADSVASAITDFLLGFGVKPVRVFGVGSDAEKVDISEEKQKVLTTLCQAFDMVYFYDDHKDNCELAHMLGSGIKVYLV